MSQADFEAFYSEGDLKKRLKASFIQQYGDWLDSTIPNLYDAWRSKSYFARKDKILSQMPKDSKFATSFMLEAASIIWLNRGAPLILGALISQLIKAVGFKDKRESAEAAAWLFAVLPGAFWQFQRDDLNRVIVFPKVPKGYQWPEKLEFRFSLKVRGRVPLKELPMETTRTECGYHSQRKSSPILGSGKDHNQSLPLDILNIQSRIPLSWNTEFLGNAEIKLDTSDEAVAKKMAKKQIEWSERAEHRVRQAMIDGHRQLLEYREHAKKFLFPYLGDRNYLTYKYDTRGRVYPVGYLLTTQGDETQKAATRLAEGESINWDE
ncbi:MAG: hypothetical protein ACMV1B_01210 [Prevotella sp.]